mmetsp:Transcript_4432/g.7544  ORF Transcript_4432/g.7544 Transcript_4432/m.7544 type:complete len:188 (+) Transcript_4432:335-898(+)
MIERWSRVNSKALPALDQMDIIDENPNMNVTRKPAPEHQHHPEYTHSSFLRLRSMENAFLMKNYLTEEKEAKQPTFSQRIQNSMKFGSKSTVPKEHQITDYDRSYGIQKIFDLHAKKDYKPETLFIAANIFDRYIYMVGLENIPKSEVVSLATISMLLSAKLEQPISPSFARMINLLTEEEKSLTSK